MLDIKLFRENPEIIKANIKKKAQDAKLPLVDKVISLDEEWRKLKSKSDELRASRNTVSREISEAKKAGKDVKELMKKASSIPDEILKVEETMAKLESEMTEIQRKLPNIMWKNVPKGKDSSENPTIKTWGKMPKFDFPIKNHVELAEALNIADFDASARVSGNGFYYLKNELALLNQALIRFAIDKMTKKGYVYVETPLMLHAKEIFASMDKAAIEQSVYSIQGEDLHLIGTSLQGLELPYRVIEICTGDLADWKYRSADLEVYRAITKNYGEVMSLSNCTDFQARKLGIKCISKTGDKRVLHTLNDTALATSRILVLLLENNQQSDGSIKIPKALWPYTGFKEIKAKQKKENSKKEEKVKEKKGKKK